MPPWAKERGQGRDYSCGGGNCPGMKGPACLRGFTRAGGPVPGSGNPWPAGGSAAGAARLLLRRLRGSAPGVPRPRLLPPRPAPPARPSALPERQREFPARKCGGPVAGAEAAQAGAGRVPSPVGRAGRRGKVRAEPGGGTPRYMARRWGNAGGTARRGGGAASSAPVSPRRPLARRSLPSFSPVSASSPRRPPGCAPSVPQRREPAFGRAGLGWGSAAAPGAPVCRGRLCPVLPRACDLGPGAELPLERREGLSLLSPAASPGSGWDAGFAADVLPWSSWRGKGCPWQQSEQNLQA